MGRATTKEDLLKSSEENFEKLLEMIQGMSEKELNTVFDFEGQPSKKEAHWKRDKNLRDILIHLHEWHQMQMHWMESNLKGEAIPFLPKPYNWKSLALLNEFFWKKHQNTSLDEAKELVMESHQKMMVFAEQFTNEELFSKGVYKWLGTSTLGSFFVCNMASHYEWAMKKLKAHRRNCK